MISMEYMCGVVVELHMQFIHVSWFTYIIEVYSMYMYILHIYYMGPT